MKLCEEFKEYENLWEDTNVFKIVIYLNKERLSSNDKDYLIDILEKEYPETVIQTEFNKSRFMSGCESAIGHSTVKYYTDSKGMAELKKACEKIPSEYKDIVNKTLNNIIVID